MIVRQLGFQGPRVAAVGLGCMGISDLYGPADEAESIATIRAALDAGITLLDTGDYYGMGHNELLIREASRGHSLRDRRSYRWSGRASGTGWPKRSGPSTSTLLPTTWNASSVRPPGAVAGERYLAAGMAYLDSERGDSYPA